MNREEYLVNRHILNNVLSHAELSNNSIAESLAPVLGCTVKAAAVRIGSIRKGETIATDKYFLYELEKILNLKKGSLSGEAITKAQLQRMKRLKERKRHDASLKLSHLISCNGRKKTVEVDKEFLHELRDLL